MNKRPHNRMSSLRKGDMDESDDDDSLFFPGLRRNKMLDKFTPTIYLTGEIEEKTAKDFRDAIKELEYIRKSDICLIIIDSPGGLVSACFEILNIMKASSMEFMTYCISHASSCAAVILSAGGEGKRFMAPLSYAMIHQISGGMFGHMEELRVSMKHTEQINRMFLREFASNCGKTIEEVEAAVRDTGSTDLFFTPQEAVEFGLVDKVGRVNLAQARAYQLELVEEDYPIEDIPEEPAQPPKKAPKRKAPARKGSRK